MSFQLDNRPMHDANQALAMGRSSLAIVRWSGVPTVGESSVNLRPMAAGRPRPATQIGQDEDIRSENGPLRRMAILVGKNRS